MKDEEEKAEASDVQAKAKKSKKKTSKSKSKSTKKTAKNEADASDDEEVAEKENLEQVFSNLKLEENKANATPSKVDKSTNVREIVHVDKEGTVSRSEVRLSDQV